MYCDIQAGLGPAHPIHETAAHIPHTFIIPVLLGYKFIAENILMCPKVYEENYTRCLHHHHCVPPLLYTFFKIVVIVYSLCQYICN